MVAPQRILVIDDDEPTVRESCRRVFGELGYEVETAASGRDGLVRARNGSFNCAAGKILAILFPIMAFVALGFEHCVANMYFIPMGLFLKGTAAASGIAGLENLTWGGLLVTNLVPVTIGNVLGGGIFVGTAYWTTYLRGQRRS